MEKMFLFYNKILFCGDYRVGNPGKPKMCKDVIAVF